MKSFLIVISIWIFNEEEWVYIGNKHVMQEPLTLQQCEKVIDLNSWKVFEKNKNYKIQLNCVQKDSGEK